MQLLNGLAWSEYLSQAKQLGLDSSYEYDHGKGWAPKGGFPGTTIALGTCFDPFTDKLYEFDVVVLDPTFFCTYPAQVYSADGTACKSDWPSNIAQFALFYTTDPILDSSTMPTIKLVKASDRINTSYYYIWLPVLTVDKEGKYRE